MKIESRVKFVVWYSSSNFYPLLQFIPQNSFMQLINFSTVDRTLYPLHSKTLRCVVLMSLNDSLNTKVDIHVKNQSFVSWAFNIFQERLINYYQRCQTHMVTLLLIRISVFRTKVSQWRLCRNSITFGNLVKVITIFLLSSSFQFQFRRLFFWTIW